MEVGNGNHYVKLKKSLVDFLIRLNVEFRDEISVDKSFLKGLAIAVFTVRKIKSSEKLSSELIGFIKGIFHRLNIKNCFNHLQKNYLIICFHIQQICFCFVSAVTRIAGLHLVVCLKKRALKSAV